MSRPTVSRGVRVRLFGFVVLASIGLVFVAAKYVGVFDWALGRNVSMYIDLPRSGGLYVGSEVDNRGVRIGKVSAMALTPDGVRLTIRIDRNAKIPVSSPMTVADLTPVGEQYVNFNPPSATGPYAASGHVFTGSEKSLPESTDRLLMDINSFVESVPKDSLRTTVGELGTVFRGNEDALGTLVNDGSAFIRTATAHQRETFSLIESAKTVLATQAAHASDIENFAHGLATFSGALSSSDRDIRTILAGGPAIREADGLVNDLRETVPDFLANLIPVNQIVTARLPALEQTLVVFPEVVSTGFTGTPGDGYGHLNMQFDYSLSACTGPGYLPKPWPNALDTSDLPLYPARCNDPSAQPGYHGPNGKLQRGVNMVPAVR